MYEPTLTVRLQNILIIGSIDSVHFQLVPFPLPQVLRKKKRKK